MNTIAKIVVLFELLKSINEGHSAECPKCNKTVPKQISNIAGLVFKGSGFYITDYNKKKTAGKTKKEKEK
jgi:predicted nucleic acid-binding Zn ribbon protein